MILGCIDIYNDEKKIEYKIKPLNKSFKDNMSNAKSLKISKALILLYAYLNKNQKKLVMDFHIEHIFPKKWQNTNYNGWNKNDAEEYLEKFGNKTIIEWKINIQAGNGYFSKKKKEHYKRSKVAEVIELSNYKKDDWSKEDIEKREEKIISALYNFFKENLS